MGLTDFDSKRMHTQLVGRADFRDLVAYEEMQRRRRIKAVLIAIGVFTGLWGCGFIWLKSYTIGAIFLCVTALIVLYLLWSSGIFRRRRYHHRHEHYRGHLKNRRKHHHRHHKHHRHHHR